MVDGKVSRGRKAGGEAEGTLPHVKRIVSFGHVSKKFPGL